MKRGLIRRVAFSGSGLIRGMAFSRSDLIRGMAFSGSGLIRGMAFGVSGLTRGGLFTNLICTYEDANFAIISMIRATPTMPSNTYWEYCAGICCHARAKGPYN